MPIEEKENEKKNDKKNDKKIKELAIEAGKIKKEFEACQQFLAAKDIIKQAKRSVMYYEGDQWSENEKKGINVEKPIMNIIQNNVDGKAANILSKNYTVNYIVNNDNVSTEQVTKFAKFQMKEMDQRKLNRSATYDALNKGTSIWYFSWDEDMRGQLGDSEGGIKGSMVDISNIAVANPREEDLQSQEYIIVRSREKIKRIKESCDFLTDEEKDAYFVSKPLNSIYKNDIEQQNEENVDVFTKFFRQNGEVFFIKCTEEMVFQEATSINPLTNLEAIKRKKKKNEKNTDKSIYEVEAPNNKMFEKPEELSQEEMMKRKYKASEYPFVFLSFIKREGSIFGVSWTHQLIALQRITNNLILTNYIGASKTALPTIVAKEGSLAGQIIDMSKPNNVIIDKSPNGVDGIKVLNTGTIPTAHFELAQSTIALLNDVYRTSEVLNDGRNIASNASGTAISQLLSIQEKPVAQWQEELAGAIEREARVLEQFYKLYVSNKKFSAEYSEAEIMQQQMQDPMNAQMYTRTQSSVFNGMDYLDTPFNVSVEVGETGKYSELVNDNFVMTLLNNGTIDNVSTQSLIATMELLSDAAFPKRKQFKLAMQQREQSEIEQLRQQVAQLQNALGMASAQNEAMKQEYTNKINIYNEQIKQAQRMMKNQESSSKES